MGARIIEESLILVLALLGTGGAFIAGMAISFFACDRLFLNKVHTWLQAVRLTFCRRAYLDYQLRELAEGIVSGRLSWRIYIGNGADRKEVVFREEAGVRLHEVVDATEVLS